MVSIKGCLSLPRSPCDRFALHKTRYKFCLHIPSKTTLKVFTLALIFFWPECKIFMPQTIADVSSGTHCFNDILFSYGIDQHFIGQVHNPNSKTNVKTTLNKKVESCVFLVHYCVFFICALFS